MGQLVRDDVRGALEAALAAAQAEGALPRLPGIEVAVERPAQAEHGDYASSVALRLARTVKQKPLAVAEAIASRVETGPLIEAVEVAPPGFINVRLAEAWKRDQVNAILTAGERWGEIDLGGGRPLQVEFVSANPTGPLQVGNGRGAVLGDVLASVLAAAGYAVEREYYVNDAGSQVRTFAQTLYARYLQQCGREAELPAEGYTGRYMMELAARVKKKVGERYVAATGEPPAALGERGLELMLAQIREDLALLGVRFDRWFHERALFEGEEALGGASTYEVAMERLREGGHVVEQEGAVWFAAQQSGEEKDNVLVRRSGEPTYFASDVAYHYDKFVRRGFTRVIDVWGTDHQGHVARTQAAVEAVGGPRDGLEVVLYQLVQLRRGSERVRMSKRTGEFVMLRELVEEVGRDVARFFLLQRSADAQMDFDLEAASSQDRTQNPVSYVQYAHARCASILRTAAEAGLEAEGDVQALREPAELALIDEMLRLPEVVDLVAQKLEPHHLPTYALQLAQQFTQFYEACRVVDSAAPALSGARLRLTLAAQTVLGRTLGLMGMGAPERM